MGRATMNKWEQLNSLLADARHYAADLKEELDAAKKQVDALTTELAEVRSEREAFATELMELRVQLTAYNKKVTP
jgi:predicted  nucleic acid-binding Zn-ribbon protein